MSEDIRSYGYMAALAQSISEDQLEDLQEKWCEDKVQFRINYEGTLVYQDMSIGKSLSEREHIYGLTLGKDTILGSTEDFIAQTVALGLAVIADTVQPYNCIWYNGSDSDMSLLSLEEFQTRTGN